MKKCKMILAVWILVALLMGCSRQASTPLGGGTTPQGGKEPPIQESIPQETLDDATLQGILEQSELSMLAAAFLQDQAYYESLGQNDEDFGKYAIIEDIDRDGHMELVYSDSLLVFDTSSRKAPTFHFLAGGSHQLMMGKDGAYMTYYSGGPGDTTYNGHDHLVFYMPYCKWDDAENSWEQEFAVLREQAMDCGCEAVCYMQDAIPRDTTSFDAFLSGQNLQPVTTQLGDFVSYSYDAKYTDCITQGLDAYFSTTLRGYQGMVTTDIDGDGQNEYLFHATKFVSPWFDNRTSDVGFSNQHIFDLPDINPADNRTGILVADVVDGQLTVTALSIPVQTAITPQTKVTLAGNALTIAGIEYTVINPGAE